MRLALALALLLALLWVIPAAAQNKTCPTRPPGDSTNACASTKFVNTPATGGTFTPNLPVIGGASGGLAQGTRSGNTTTFPTVDSTPVPGNCAVFDSAGGLNNVACSPSGSGTVGAGLVGQFAYYPSAGTSVTGIYTFQTPQMYDPICGTAGHDCTTGMLDCLESGAECFLPCGTYYLPTGLTVLAADSAGYGNLRGSGHCSIVQGGAASIFVLALGGTNSCVPTICFNRTNMQISDFQISSGVTQTNGGGLWIEACNQCVVRNVDMIDGNVYIGLRMTSDQYFEVDNLNVFSCHNDGVQMYSDVGGILSPTVIVNGCTGEGFHTGGFVNGNQFDCQAILNGDNGFLIDESFVAARNTQFFFGQFFTMDTNAHYGLLVQTNTIVNGATSGVIFKGWSSSNGLGGIFINNQSAIWTQIVGAMLIGNHTANIQIADVGWIIINDNFIYNSVTQYGIIGPGVNTTYLMITGNIIANNSSGSVVGFNYNSGNVCNNNVGGSGGC